MGDYIHRALIATHHDVDVLGHAKRIAYEHGLFSIIIICNNGLFTFFMPPSGGKVGWPIEDEAMSARHDVASYLSERQIPWFEVKYGDVPPEISAVYEPGVIDVPTLCSGDSHRHHSDDTGDQVVGAIPEEGAMEEKE